MCDCQSAITFPHTIHSLLRHHPRTRVRQLLDDAPRVAPDLRAERRQRGEGQAPLLLYPPPVALGRGLLRRQLPIAHRQHAHALHRQRLVGRLVPRRQRLGAEERLGVGVLSVGLGLGRFVNYVQT